MEHNEDMAKREWGMRWLRRVTEENLILINYHKMVNSPETMADDAEVLEGIDPMPILTKACGRSGYELLINKEIKGVKEVECAVGGTCGDDKLTYYPKKQLIELRWKKDPTKRNAISYCEMVKTKSEIERKHDKDSGGE